jgi:protein-tyrosine phosphatase
MAYAPGQGDEVPDPYYGGVEDFERVVDLCEAAARGLMTALSRPE